MARPMLRCLPEPMSDLPTPQRTEPSFRIIVWLAILVLAAGLIGGGWYGHSRIAEDSGPVPGSTTVSTL